MTSDDSPLRTQNGGHPSGCNVVEQFDLALQALFARSNVEIPIGGESRLEANIGVLQIVAIG